MGGYSIFIFVSHIFASLICLVVGLIWVSDPPYRCTRTTGYVLICAACLCGLIVIMALEGVLALKFLVFELIVASVVCIIASLPSEVKSQIVTALLKKLDDIK